jgi:hypothetical protein
VEPRFGLCTPIAVAEAGLSVSRGAGSGEAATRTRGRATGLSVRSSCRRFGRSLEESTPGAMTIQALILRANNALFPACSKAKRPQGCSLLAKRTVNGYHFGNSGGSGGCGGRDLCGPDGF